MPSFCYGFGSLTCAVLCWGSLLFWATQGRAAQVPDELNLQASGACPSGDSVERQLKPLLPSTQLHVGAAGSGQSAQVLDNGSSFTIRVGGAERVISEPARDCMERARISAVFIALVLDPPFVVDETPTPVASPGPIAPAPLAPVDVIEPSIFAGASVGLALGTPAARRWGLGPSLGVALGAKAWEVALNGALLTPFTLEFSTGSVRLVRAPFDLSYRWLSSGYPLRVHFGVGVQTDLLHLSGVGFERSERSLRVGVGARCALGLRRAFESGWSGVVEVSYAYFPRPYILEVSPRRELGKTPSSWLGLSLGAIL